MSKILSFSPLKFAQRLEKARQHKNMNQKDFAQTYDKSFPDKEGKSKYNTVRKWETGKHNPRFGDIINACQILDCDISYLSGDNPEDVFRMDNYNAADTIGLDYSAIEKLKEYPTEIKDLLNRLILNGNGDNLLKLLEAMHTYANGAHHANVHLDVTGDTSYNNIRSTEKLIGAAAVDGRTLPDITKKMLKYSVTSTLDEVLTDSYNSYIEDGNKRLKERYAKLASQEKARWKRLHDTNWRTLSIEETSFLMGETWGDKIPSQEERFAEIDSKYKALYETNKEPS